jgi:hypothetical protein
MGYIVSTISFPNPENIGNPNLYEFVYLVDSLMNSK